MYCLEKLQAELVSFLKLDKATLPSIEDNLKQAGYIGILKNDEALYFSQGLQEFGRNYPQYYHKPQEAITHLLERKEGQVAGAFYKEGLGDIDLVWGDSSFGLAHILERRTQDFIKEGLSEAEARAKAREFVESIPEIIENGKIRKEKTRAFIEFNDKQSVIALDYKGDDSRKGAKHIKLSHSTDKTQKGYVTKLEIARLGRDIRAYLKENEPFIDNNGARIYEWEKDNVRFRVVINDIQEVSSGNSHLPSANEEIITFYSDRNQAQMQFKNPKLLKEQVKNSKGNK